MNKPQTGTISFDIDARHAHVLGDGPRIAAIPNEDVAPETFALINQVRAGAGAAPTTVVPEYMRTIIKHPALFRGHMEMGDVVFQGVIPKRERELAVLRIGWLSRAPYEWGQHVIIAKRLNMPSEEIKRVTLGSSAPGWTDHEAAILRGVEELLADQSLSDATWNTLAATWNEQQLIEYVMMVGHYVAAAFVQNTLRIRLAEGNPGMTAA